MSEPELGPNLVAMFERQSKHYADRPFLWRKDDGVYRPLSWNTVREMAQTLAQGLRAKGIGPGDHVVLVANNRPEWLIADLAVMAAGGATVPAYTTNTSEDHAYVLSHSEAKAVIFSGGSVAERLMPALAQNEQIEFAVAIDPTDKNGVEKTFSWDDMLAEGRNQGAVEHNADIDDMACIIYTSGTGGRPKGVMLSHRNIMANLAGAGHLLREIGLDDEVFLSFLPLSHSYEHTGGQFFPMAIGAQIYYAEGVDTVSANLVEARPTMLTCVPRLYEVLRTRISKQVERKGGRAAQLFHKAIELGTKRYEGQRLSLVERGIDLVCDHLVRRKVAERFGGRLKALVSGGAPLNYDVGLFFASLNLPIVQGYGQTEASPVISANRPSRPKLDTVGKPLKGVDVHVADDGEILIRGDLVMKGYWRDPEATQSTIVDGWLHTGDVGYLDDEGAIVITDRKKDLIVNSGGDNIAPQRVEGILMLEPEIAQVLVHGDQRPYLVALIVPDKEFMEKFARESGSEPELETLREDKSFVAAIQEAVNRANKKLSLIERVRKFHIMEYPFTIDNNMMTPTLKLRRPIIKEQFKSTLDQLYGA
ncbi:MAG: AMP-dependent synthetase/ligase [Geminicoccaceae bacterium]